LQYNLRNILGGHNLLVQAYGRREEADFGASFAKFPNHRQGLLFPYSSLQPEETPMYMEQKQYFPKNGMPSASPMVQTLISKISKGIRLYLIPKSAVNPVG
jgi:hypothetical protein